MMKQKYRADERQEMRKIKDRYDLYQDLKKAGIEAPLVFHIGKLFIIQDADGAAGDPDQLVFLKIT